MACVKGVVAVDGMVVAGAVVCTDGRGDISIQAGTGRVESQPMRRLNTRSPEDEYRGKAIEYAPDTPYKRGDFYVIAFDPSKVASAINNGYQDITEFKNVIRGSNPSGGALYMSNRRLEQLDAKLDGLRENAYDLSSISGQALAQEVGFTKDLSPNIKGDQFHKAIEDEIARRGGGRD